LLGSYVVVGFSKTSDEAAKRALEELKSLGTLAHAVEWDAATAEGARNLAAEVEKIYGRLDLLVNTLKFEPQSSFEETGEDAWQKTIAANLKSVFFVTQSVLPLMSPRPKPAIVNLVADCGENSVEKNPAFAATQAAVVGLTGQLARRLPKNFRVNCVSVVEKTEEVKGESESFGLFQTTGKSVAFDDVARVVIYLLSGEAKALNGQVLTVDKR
jgi:3-oxoacyl-[acyl-carrier protein] reductase